MFHNLGGRAAFDDVEVQLIRWDRDDPASNELAHALLRVTVTGSDPARSGRAFAAKVIELGLATVPGLAAPPGGGFSSSGTTIHWPALIASRRVRERVHLGGETVDVAPAQALGLAPHTAAPAPAPALPPAPSHDLIDIPFGRLFGTRSGDKGGDANVGVWARSDLGFAFLSALLTLEEFKRLLPDMAGFEIARFDLPNIRALNFVIRGVLAPGAAANARLDRQAKTLGDYLGAKIIRAPRELVQP